MYACVRVKSISFIELDTTKRISMAEVNRRLREFRLVAEEQHLPLPAPFSAVKRGLMMVAESNFYQAPQSLPEGGYYRNTEGDLYVDVPCTPTTSSTFAASPMSSGRSSPNSTMYPMYLPSSPYVPGSPYISASPYVSSSSLSSPSTSFAPTPTFYVN